MTRSVLPEVPTVFSTRNKHRFGLVPYLVFVASVLLLAATTRAQSTEKVLYNFSHSGQTGGRLISDKQGNLYGVTPGFEKNFGTVFELQRLRGGRWVHKLLYKFTGGTDGAYPRAGLAFDKPGNLYGATLVGGTNSCDWTTPKTCGVLFELSPTAQGPWTETVLYNFPGAGGPAIPSTGLFPDSAGNLYGGTATGGPKVFDGTIFRLTQQPDGSWVEEQIYTFTSTNPGGMDVPGSITFDSAGNLYGATLFAGNGSACSDLTNGCGTVFQLSPGAGGVWTYTLVYSFCSQTNCADGGYPNGVVVDSAGNLYGTTGSGAVQFQNGGTVFELSPDAAGGWTFHLLYSFCALSICTDGTRPSAAPIRDMAGNLYGPTVLGGTFLNNSGGTVFELSPSQGGWTYQTAYDFCALQGCSDGFEPTGELTLDRNGNLYGTTPVGGLGAGVTFEIRPQ